MNEYIDDWDFSYIKDLDNNDLLAWSDKEAYERYPNYNWVYDKYIIHHKFNDPHKYPLIVKSRTNLEGMGKGTFKVNNEEQLKEAFKDKNIVIPYYNGIHYSIDIVIEEFKPIDSWAFLCYKDELGSFTLFESIETPNKALEIASQLNIKRGVINIELIGDKLIEIHLRPSLSFFDICGGMQEQLPNFIKTGKYKKTKYQKTYSMVWRSEKDLIPLNIKRANLEIPEGVYSCQRCFYWGVPLSEEVQDEYSFRMIAVNGIDKEEIKEFGDKIIDNIEWKNNGI